jgi:hypothetical protein
MRPWLLLAAALAACTPEPLRDRPQGMLAPFPADAAGREVPHERMVPLLVQQSVALATRGPLEPPAAQRAGALVDLRNEPVIVLGASGAAGIGAPWPDRTFTLRPPTREELAIAPLGSLGAGTPLEGWQRALAWLRAEAGRTRPGLQRYTETVLIVADGSSPAEDARAAATVLTGLGAARKARVAVIGPDGLWAALPLPESTLPVRALEEAAASARAAAPVTGTASPATTRESNDTRRKLEAVLAQPIPGPRCLEVEVAAPSGVLAAAHAALAGAGPQDVVAVRGFAPTLAQYLDPTPLAGSLAPRVRLGDRCE